MRGLTSSLILSGATLGLLGCQSKEPSGAETTTQGVASEQARHPHDGVGEQGASPHGASPHGASPHGASPHGASPHGASPHGAAGQQGAMAADAGATPQLAVTWTTPKDWQEMPKKSAMRAATYQAPGADGSAEIAVFYFGPSQGGDVESNISRWIGQFQDTSKDAISRSTRDENGLKQYLVKVTEGTFSSGMPGGPTEPQKSWGMEGAIVETPSGSYFFKMTGPAKTVAQQSEAFHSLLKSIKTKS